MLILEIAAAIILAYVVIMGWRKILAVTLTACVGIAIALVCSHYLDKWAMDAQFAARRAQLIACVHRYCDGRSRQWKVDRCGFPLPLMIAENADDVVMNNKVMELAAIATSSPIGRWCDAHTKPWWEFDKPWWSR